MVLQQQAEIPSSGDSSEIFSELSHVQRQRSYEPTVVDRSAAGMGELMSSADCSQLSSKHAFDDRMFDILT